MRLLLLLLQVTPGAKCIITLAVIVALVTFDKGQGQVCEEGSTNRVPYNFAGDEPSGYSTTGVNSELRIFTSLRITCDGLLTSWRFIPRRRDVSRLHFAVFRNQSIEGLASTFYKLVDETYLQNSTIAKEDVDRWIYVAPTRQIRVRRGDFLGLFYDSVDLPREDSPIYYKRQLQTKTKQNEFILSLNRTVLYRNKKIVTVPNEVRKDYRVPALTAMVLSTSGGDDSDTPSDDSMVAAQALRVAMRNSAQQSQRTTRKIATSTTTTTTTTRATRATRTRTTTTTTSRRRLVREVSLQPLLLRTLLPAATEATMFSGSKSEENGDEIYEYDDDEDYDDETTSEEPATTITTTTRRRTTSSTTTKPFMTRGVLLPLLAAEMALTTTRRKPTTTTTEEPPAILDYYVADTDDYYDNGNEPTPPPLPSTTTTQHRPWIRPIYGTQRPSSPTVGRLPRTNASICNSKPIDVLKCESLTYRAYYDPDERFCKPFWGCGPLYSDTLPNNFPTVMQCVETCYTPDTIDPVCLNDATMLSMCDQPAELRYYFSKEQKRCLSFRGCGLGFQNGNNFGSLRECTRRCSGLVRPRILPVNHQPRNSRPRTRNSGIN